MLLLSTQSISFTKGLKLSTESLIETAMVSSDPTAACFVFHQEESGYSQLSSYNSIAATIYCEKITERDKMSFVETKLRRQSYGASSKQRSITGSRGCSESGRPESETFGQETSC